MKRSVSALPFALAICLGLTGAGCGDDADEPQQVSSTGGEAGGAGLVLGQDLTCQVALTQLFLRADGQFFVDSTFVGTFVPDGGFFNVDGNEIGRLQSNGRMTFGGVLQDATVEGTRLVGPSGTIAFIDQNGYLNITGAATPPSPIIGGTPATARTFLFLFAMYAGLVDVAMHMQEEQPQQ